MESAILKVDAYKLAHHKMYPDNLEYLWSNLTPRYTHVPDEKSMIFFGLQYFALKFLIKDFNRTFFNRKKSVVLKEYADVMRECMADPNADLSHIEALHDLGYLPITIYALPEGTAVSFGVPPFVITNTDPRFAWLVNYLETIISNYLWKPCTTATTAKRFRRLFLKYAKLAGATDFTFVDYQGHDFSFRGLDEEAITGCIGHLLSFNGSDTIPAMIRAKEYYKAPLNCGVSVPATEHSVMCAALRDGEFNTFVRLLDKYPTGILSVVSDTWDLWTVLTDYLPRLKDRLLARDGRLVIRPDSGDPVLIVCGDPSYENVSGEAYGLDRHPAYYGVIRLIEMAMGSTQTDAGKYLNSVGCIYGDGISPQRAEAILKCLVENGYSPYNIVFGIGSYTYQMVTRDTYGLAMKATAEGITGGEIIPMFKCPVTDEAKVPKKSAKGIPVVYQNKETGEFYMVETNDPSLLDQCAFRKVFSDSKLLVKDKLENIKNRVREAA